MKKLLLMLALLASFDYAISKTTYIPTYRSYIHILNGNDTLSVTNRLITLELSSNNRMFTVRIEHEDVTKEKVKAIKRAKNAAGWATVSAVLSGVSTALSDNNLEYMVRSANTEIAKDIASIYELNAKAEEKLKVRVWIENTSEEEIMVNDMERGLVWYIQPMNSLYVRMNNPDAASLRISDIHNKDISFVMATAGSSVTKHEIVWEDEYCWIVPVYKEKESFYEDPRIEKYRRIWKKSFEDEEMSNSEFKEFKKRNK